MMQLGAGGRVAALEDARAHEHAVRARAIVEATTFHDDPAIVAKVSRGLGEAMVGIGLDELGPSQRYADRGW
jgi:pyridoxal 5'-phosphate synthase pdxS subunit